MAALFALLALSQATAISVVPMHPKGEYRVGEVVGWTIRGDGQRAYDYVLRRFNEQTVAQGTIPASDATQRITVQADEPAMYFLKITPRDGSKALDFGAAVSPERIRPASPRPRDFDAFWAAQLRELRRVPAEPQFRTATSPLAGVEYGLVAMNHVNGTKVYGQFAKPARPGKFPAVLQLQWAGGPYPLDPWWIVGRARQGFIVLNIQAHDVEAIAPPSYFQALPASLKNYTGNGAKYFVEMYLRGVRAADWLVQRPDWDGKTLIVSGTSMGGQQGWAVAGLHPRVTHLMINVPAGCDIAGKLHGRQSGYPFFPNDPLAAYVDGTHFAPRIRARSLVGIGYVDDVCPPGGIWAALNGIRGPKEPVPMFDSPHNHLATPEQQRPWSERSEAWFAALAPKPPAGG